jgi:type II secretory ATPase GspE/PulE/Tfp pilus assembly ATPase PilB-like protein
VVFGFGKRKQQEIEEEEPEIEQILFQGSTNGQEANLKANARLVQAGLMPAKELVTDAILRRADRIRIDPKGKVSTVTLYIDGIAYPGGRMSSQQGLAITQMIKLLAGLDIKERQKTQISGIKAEQQSTPYELKVVSAGTPSGERLMIYVRNTKLKNYTPEALNFSDDMRAKIRGMMSSRSGIIIVCGPSFSGVTTTTVAVLRTVDAYLYSIYSLADPDGRDLGNVTHFDANEGDSFDATLTRLMRMEADIVFLNPLRDAETAKTMFARQEDIAMICEMQAKDAAGGIAQLVQWVGDPALVANGLRGVVSQKLIRAVCTKCREAFRPNPKLIQQVGLPPETRLLYRAGRTPQPEPGQEPIPPCEVCGGIGFIGQAGMFELIEMTEGMKEVIAAGGDPAAIKTQARKEKMQSLQQEGLRLVAEGKTTLEELKRAFKPA